MKSRWDGALSLCNRAECEKKHSCWRFRALVRLGDDQSKNIQVPRVVSVIRPEWKKCRLFIQDEYVKKEADNSQ